VTALNFIQIKISSQYYQIVFVVTI